MAYGLVKRAEKRTAACVELDSAWAHVGGSRTEVGRWDPDRRRFSKIFFWKRDVWSYTWKLEIRI